MSNCRAPVLFLVIIFLQWPQPARPDDASWRLHRAAGLPDTVMLSGQHRSRFENLAGQYRAGRGGGDQALMLRTVVLAGIEFESVKVAAEVMDSRAELADAGTPLSTSFVNPAELLQAYAEIAVRDWLAEGSRGRLRGGRITMDVGSRRLVARNRFRNTINAFTGVDWQWNGPDESVFRAFYTLPIQRRVNGSALDNEARFDKEHDDVRFWGLYYSPAALPWGDKGEVYYFGLDESDAPGLSTRNRDIHTIGFRLHRSAAKGRFDYQLESVWQFGESRASAAATDVTDLDHFAHFQHLELGYSFDAPWSPRLLFQYDYASGDDDPADGDNNRFDTLFGARRFDFGPTSLYGPFARSNLSTPGVRLKLKPRSNVTSFVSARAFWLASNDDAWTTAGIRTPAGSEDSYIGSQIEARLRWELLPGNVRFETGAAHLFAGDVMKAAGKDDATYFYTQLVLWF